MKKNLLKVVCLLLLSFILGACGSSNTDPISDPLKGTLIVTNSSVKTISGLYISPTTQNTWGVNQLSSNIDIGTSRTVINIPVGIYDIKYTFTDGTSLVSGTTLVVTPSSSSTRTISKSLEKAAGNGQPFDAISVEPIKFNGDFSGGDPK